LFEIREVHATQIPLGPAEVRRELAGQLEQPDHVLTHRRPVARQPGAVGLDLGTEEPGIVEELLERAAHLPL